LRIAGRRPCGFTRKITEGNFIGIYIKKDLTIGQGVAFGVIFKTGGIVIFSNNGQQAFALFSQRLELQSNLRRCFNDFLLVGFIAAASFYGSAFWFPEVVFENIRQGGIDIERCKLRNGIGQDKTRTSGGAKTKPLPYQNYQYQPGDGGPKTQAGLAQIIHRHLRA